MIDWNGLILELNNLGSQVHVKHGTTEGGLYYGNIVYINITVNKDSVDNIIKSYFDGSYILKSNLMGGHYKSSISEIE